MLTEQQGADILAALSTITGWLEVLTLIGCFLVFSCAFGAFKK